MSRAGAIVLVLAVALAIGGVAIAADGARDAIEARREVLARTHAMLVDKAELRGGELRTRVRALYKLSRAGWAPLWIDPTERTAMLRRRAAARRILARDLEELAILEDELNAAEDARVRLIAEAALADEAARPPPHSLVRPVAGAIASRFGRFRGRRSDTRLVQRGVALAATEGEPVSAPLAGIIRYIGPIRGLGDAVVIEREDGVRAVLGPISRISAVLGHAVEAGAPLGQAAGAQVYLEVRIAVGAGGLPVDPAPLLAR